jgi:hypothetical protein
LEVRETTNKKAVWVDLLCWESAWAIIAYSARSYIETIHYVNVAASFKRFVPWFERRCRAKCICADGIAQADVKWQGMSLYETIQDRITDTLFLWTNRKEIKDFIGTFSAAHGYNPDKFEAHLKEAAYPHVFRMIEINVLADHMYGPGNCMFVIRRTPFKRWFKVFLGPQRVLFYRTVISHRGAIEPRKDHYYDAHMNPVYYKGRLGIVGHFAVLWLFNAISALVNGWRSPKTPAGEAHIGLELTQSRQRMDAINDLAWFEHSGIDPKHVRAFEFTNYDEESIARIRSLGIQRYKVIQFPSQLIHRLKSFGRDQDVTSLTPRPSFGIKTAPAVVQLARGLLIWNEASWLRFQSVKYICRTAFWQSVYDSLGIKVLWTMFDIDDDKLTKGQAVENLGGLSVSGHWSNFPMYRIDNQKCSDVILTWGEHFIKNNFQRSLFMGLFLVGYPCDYYFPRHKESALAIRQRHEGKFIISYHDNIMGNDLPYSKGMQLEIHEMLLSILKKFENVIVLLKPKRKFVLDEIIRELPELEYYVKQGRLEIFIGDTPRTKAVPAEIGKASDLVIGLGISSTAAEAYFAGTVAFHADFTGFERNEFGNRGQGVIVFRDIFTLENAINDRIKGKNKWTFEDYRGYYTALDPFQDGCAARRIGFILKRIREHLAHGLNRYVLLEKVKKDYDVYLSSMKSLSSVSLN